MKNLLSAWLLVAACTSLATAQRTLLLEHSPASRAITVRMTNDVALYFLMERSTNLSSFVPWSMRLGHGGPAWNVSYDSALAVAFFRARWFSLYAPGDVDKDGLDDVWELDHADVLDPLNPADASRVNPKSGLTYLEDYRLAYGRITLNDQAISPEVSLFNFGVDLPGGQYEAISAEASLYNHGEDLPGVHYEAISKPVSLYFGEHPPHAAYPDSISSEISLYNHGVDRPGGIGAVSQEISIYRGEKPPQLHEVEGTSPEMSVYNLVPDVPGGSYEAISLETSLFNGDRGGLY